MSKFLNTSVEWNYTRGSDCLLAQRTPITEVTILAQTVPAVIGGESGKMGGGERGGRKQLSGFCFLF